MTSPRETHKEEKQLPKVQILLAVLFGLVVLLAPLFTRSLEAIIFLASAAGLGLGGVTARIGWAVLVQKKAAVYPFQEWSLSLLNWMYGAQATHELEKKKRPPSAARQNWLGIASLVCGGLVAVAALGAALYALSQLV